MEHTERVKTKLNEMTELLLNDLEAMFGKLDKESHEISKYMIYCALYVMSDEVLDDLMKGVVTTDGKS